MVRLLLFIVLLIAFDLYVFQAFAAVSQNWSRWAKYALYGCYWAITLIAVATLVLYTFTDHHTITQSSFGIIRAVLFIAYLSKLFVVVFLLIDDLRRVGYWAWQHFQPEIRYNASRSTFLSNIGVLTAALPFTTLLYGILRNRHRYKLFSETIQLDQLPKELDGLKIVQISDIHSGSFTDREPLREAIRLINKQEADLVFFTGDLVNSKASEMTPYKDIFSQVRAKHGVYSVLGNHDYGDYVHWPTQEMKAQNFEQLLQTHRDLGWDLMLNENRLLNINGQQVAVIGVENYSAHPRFPKYGDLQKASEGTQQAALKLLLSHDPTHWEFEVIERFKDIALTFSGHTHGMQFGVEIPGWIRWSPAKYIYKQWAGLYRKEQQYIYVNRGLGYLGYPGRVGILPEVSLITLRTKAAEEIG